MRRTRPKGWQRSAGKRKVRPIWTGEMSIALAGAGPESEISARPGALSLLGSVVLLNSRRHIAQRLWLCLDRLDGENEPI